MVLPRISLMLKLFLVASAIGLTGCCASGNGCYAPSPGMTAWDGLGSPPTEGEVPDQPRRRTSRSGTEVTIARVGSGSALQAAKPGFTDWAREEALERDADAKLAKKLLIC